MVSLETLKELAQNYTVLYVEDDDTVRVGVLRYLNNFFLNVQEAVNGEEGLSLYKKSTYDIVITDINMPIMNGIDMAKKIREINEDQEILIVSAYSDTSFFLDTIHIGISGYIIKPIDFRQINKVLYKILYRLQKFKENKVYKTNLEELVELKSQEQRENYEKTILSLVTMIEKRDTYTGGHSQRVADYSKLIAQDMGYDKKECDLVYQAGILHDIGKITTPDNILLKPGKLSDLEYHIIQEHVQMSADLLSKIPMYKDFLEIIIAHHEHYDGSGYPNGLKADEIPELASIMIVADAFDAMTTSRIYKARKSIDSATQEIEKLSGIHFNPLVVQSAVKVLSNIDISNTISQEPESEVERERFAYFYKDQITDLHNSRYLDLMLIKNVDTKKYTHLYVIYLHNISNYNLKNGWIDGDKLLNKFADVLKEKFPNALLFRVNGANYIILGEESYDIDINTFKSISPLQGSEVTLSTKSINIKDKNPTSLERLEKIIF